MSAAQIEQIAIVMAYLYEHGFTKSDIKRAVDAWWKVKQERPKP